MKRWALGQSLIVAALVLGNPAISAAAQSASYSLPAAWCGGSGGEAASASYRQTASMGQAAAGPVAWTPNYALSVGFAPAIALAAGGIIVTTTVVVTPDDTTHFCVYPAYGRVCLTIPPGTFTRSVAFTASVPLTYPAASSPMNRLMGTPVGLETSAAPGDAPLRPITHDFTYNAAAMAAVEDESRLTLMRYLPEEARWLAIDRPARDTAARTISVQTPTLGLMRALEVLPGAGVGAAYIYPNPFRANLGHTVMRLTNLPAFATLEICTITGQTVRKLTADSAGLAVWDLLNDDGEKVGSDVYLAILRSNGEKRTYRLGVQR